MENCAVHVVHVSELAAVYDQELEPWTRQQIGELETRNPARLVIDLTSEPFIDARGYRALLRVCTAHQGPSVTLLLPTGPRGKHYRKIINCLGIFRGHQIKVQMPA